MFEQLDRVRYFAVARQLSGKELLSIMNEFILVATEFQSVYEQFGIDYKNGDFRLHPLDDVACAKFFSAIEIQPMTYLLDAAASSSTPAPTPDHRDPVEIADAKLRIVSTEGLRWTISWMIEVANNTTSPVTLVITAKFNDADGFTVAKAHKLGLTVPAHGTITFSDLTSVEPAVGQEIESMSVEFFEQ